MKMKGSLSCIVIGLMLTAVDTATSQISYDGTALNYSQNFDSLGTTTITWMDNSTLAGWYMNSTVLGIPPSLTTSFGNAIATNAYNVGVAGVDPSSDRAIAWSSSNTSGTSYIGLQLLNNSGRDYIGDVTFSFTYEQWSARNTLSDPLALDYQANVVAAGNQLLLASGWNQLASIDSPNLSNAGGGATHYIDGNAPGNYVIDTVTVSFTEGSPWLAGEYLWFRTRDEDISGSDDMNAIDDVSVTITPVPEPSSQALLEMALLGLAGIFRCRKR